MAPPPSGPRQSPRSWREPTQPLRYIERTALTSMCASGALHFAPAKASLRRNLAQIPAEALDALARILQRRRGGGVGDAEGRAEPEGRALHHRDAFGLQELGDEILVAGELLPGPRGIPPAWDRCC